MIVILNFCNHDRDMALRQLRWIGELGAGKKHDIILQFSQGVKAVGGQHELIEEATKHFNSCSNNTPCTEEERGWPRSPNHGWLAAVTLVREKVMKPWLWMEPDLTILTATAFDQFEAEYQRVNPEVDPKAKVKPTIKPFMGAEVISPAGRRMSGCGMYPAKVVAFMARKRLHDFSVREEAFDSYLASEIVPFAHFTPLLQNVHLTSRDPDISPSFPTQESLSILDPRAAMFHRCKDGTLIDRFQEVRRYQGPSVMDHPDPITGTVLSPPLRAALVECSKPSREMELEMQLQQLRSEIAAKEEAKSKAASDRMKAAWAKRKSKAAKKAERAARKAA